MRADIQKIVFLENNKKRSDTGSFFRSYALRRDIGNRILNGLFSKTVETDGVKHFVLDDVEKRTGFLSDVYGCVGVFSLINRMQVKLTAGQKEDLSKTIDYLLEYMNKKGFTMEPYVDRHEDGLFNKGTPFFGAMTWSLSLLVNLCRSLREGFFEYDDSKNEIVYKLIAQIIDAFNQGAKMDSDGNCIGWSFTIEAKQPSLFYTYSVLESFSDFEDSVLGGEDVDIEQNLGDAENSDATLAIGKRDEHLIDAINRQIDRRTLPDGRDVTGLKFWRECCFSAASYVWNKAEDIIKENFIGDNFYTEDNVVPEIKEADILKSSTSNALFNTLFVVFTGIYGYVNKVDQNGNNNNIESVIETMREALQNVQKTYELLVQRGMEYVVGSYSLLFQTGIGKRSTDIEKTCSVRLNSENIFDSSLLPLLVKSNSMMAFYIQQFPQKQMGQLFEKLFDSISVPNWTDQEVLVWDANKYNVKNTERYLEAVADFYDYFDVYEKSYVKNKEQNDATIAARIEKEKETWKRENQAEALREAEARFEDWQKAEMEKHEFESIFAKEIKRLAAEAFEERMIRAIDTITSAREYNQKLEPDSFEAMLAERFSELLISILDRYLLDHYRNFSVEQLHDVVKKDVALFLTTYAERIAQAAKDDKPVLNNVVFNKEN